MKPRELQNFRAALLAWFRQFQRDLPWRRTPDPYRIWLSEIMLQQTRVAAVIPYYERFLARFPDVHSLAEAPEQEVIRLWSGLGYYSRAHHLQEAARQIVARHNGEFPSTREAALALPGIGVYTAAAILSIAFGEKLAVLDGNVARVIARLEAVRGDLREGQRWRKLQASADDLLDKESPGDWNQAMMELGATLCTPRAPQCLLCPVASHCQGRKLGIAESLPAKRKKRETVDVTLVSLVLLSRRNETLLLPGERERRKTAADVATLVSGMKHFPTVALASEPLVELRRLLRSVAGKAPGKSNPPVVLNPIRHAVTYRRVTVLPYMVEVPAIPRITGASVLPLDAVLQQPVSNLTRKIARAALKATS